MTAFFERCRVDWEMMFYFELLVYYLVGSPSSNYNKHKPFELFQSKK